MRQHVRLLRTPAGTSSRLAPTLLAGRRLGVLDELRVPYRLVDPAAGWPWASLCTEDPHRALCWYARRAGDIAAGWSLGSLRIWGHVAPDVATARYVGSIGGEWTREIPIIDASGAVRSWVWRSSDGGTVFPFDPDELVMNLRSERYLTLHPSTKRSLNAFGRRAYYASRPLLPRSVQIEARRAFSRIQARTAFPRWPVEPALHDLIDFVLQRVADMADRPVPYIASWPRGRSWALVLTHDVETGTGRDAIEMVRAVEQAAGYRSAWNLVPERYRVPDALIEHLKAAGCEVGVHGLRHDGRDLESLDTAGSRLPEMRRWARRWEAVGFRSPATLRNWEWMPKLGFAYDSSYPDTDPYEPMAGGCCSWLPFFNREMVELPITLPQDHTVFVILRRDESVWCRKTELLRARGGMALVIVHPDYMMEADRLDAYGRFLQTFRDDAGAWKPLPREVADWWHRRAATSLRSVDGDWHPIGPADKEVAVKFAEPVERSGTGTWT